MKRLNFPVHTLTISISTPQHKMSQLPNSRSIGTYQAGIEQIPTCHSSGGPRSWASATCYEPSLVPTRSLGLWPIPKRARPRKRELPQAGDQGNLVSYLLVPPTTYVRIIEHHRAPMFTSMVLYKVRQEHSLLFSCNTTFRFHLDYPVSEFGL